MPSFRKQKERHFKMEKSQVPSEAGERIGEMLLEPRLAYAGVPPGRQVSVVSLWARLALAQQGDAHFPS